jgi:undecaprenyl-diphosphatase
MYEALVSFDRNLFLALNSSLGPSFDTFMVWVADRFIWIPLYALLAFMLVRKFGFQSLYMILFAGLMITISDQGSVLLKNTFLRERPCHDDTISLMVHTVGGHCGGQYGFVSSHASNTMALFTYLLLMLRNTNRLLTAGLALWVVLIGYCRIYLGVHFPADIIGGWLMGIFSAFLTYGIYRSLFDSPKAKLFP